MRRFSRRAWLVGMLGITLALASGCSKQMETKSGSVELGKQPMAQAPGSEAAGGGNGPLKGFEPAALGGAPSEERVSEGIVVAKAEPPAAARQQAEEMLKEQVVTTLVGLQDVFFAFDSWKITEEGRQSLGFDAQWLKEHQDKQLAIEGHCDQRGTQAYNLVLSEKRAKAVRT